MRSRVVLAMADLDTAFSRLADELVIAGGLPRAIRRRAQRRGLEAFRRGVEAAEQLQEIRA
jgi:hypothetical protein